MKRAIIKKRYLFIFLGIAVFLPPLSIIPQVAGEVNMCGSICPRMFFIMPTKDIGAGFLNNINSMFFGFLLVSLILLITLFFGRLWCSHLCPVGGISELSNKLIPHKWKMDFSSIEAPAFRYGYMFIYIGGAFLGIGSIACKLCNFRVIPFLVGSPFVPAYRTYLMTSMGIAGLGLIGVLALAIRGGRVYCNLLCPVGALDALLNRLGLRFGKRVRTDEARCDGCGRCVEPCTVWAIRLENGKSRREQLSCISCRECERVCPNKAISYGRH